MENGDYFITDIYGKCLLSDYKSLTIDQITIDVTELPSGIYTFHFLSDNIHITNSQTLKFNHLMKKHLFTAIAVMALCCLYFSVSAQTEPNDFATFFIDMTNSIYEPTVATASNGDGVDVLFSLTGIKDIAQNYSFHQLRRAFPNATDPTWRTGSLWK